MKPNSQLQRNLSRAFPNNCLFQKGLLVLFWCFVFLSRCLIYKVHAARCPFAFQPVQSGLHCTTLASACQVLFSALSLCLPAAPERKSLASPVRAAHANFDMIPCASAFVKYFFHPVLPVCRTALPEPGASWLPRTCRFVKRLINIPEDPAVVNTFFRFFSIFYVFPCPGRFFYHPLPLSPSVSL